MRGLVVAAVIGVCAGGAELAAQEAAAPPAASPAAHFAPMEFLVGSCWVGTFPDGKQTDEHCFEWLHDRKLIRDRHVVRGGRPYEGESIYAWDPKARRLHFAYWSSAGQLTTGHVEPGAEGLVFPERYTTPKGEVEMRAVWTRTGPDGYRVVQRQRADSGWVTLWTMELARKR